jgi:signal transduction histidine kinase
VIESHGGSISASNVPGGGLVVNIELPLLQG